MNCCIHLVIKDFSRLVDNCYYNHLFNADSIIVLSYKQSFKAINEKQNELSKRLSTKILVRRFNRMELFMHPATRLTAAAVKVNLYQL